MRYKLACIALLFLSVFSAAAATLKIDAAHPGAAISPTMWGIFFEDVNFAADGGLYAEMVKNRSFEFPDPMMGWTRIGDGQLSIQEKNPLSSNERHYLRVHSIGPVPTGVSNEGFRGMGISQDERYDFSAEIRRVSGAPELEAQLVAADGAVLASARLKGFSAGWKRCAVVLRPNRNEWKARLNVLLTGDGTLDLDRISLFPEHTWKNRPGGLRADLAQMLADLKPGFVRFPGGCLVEGSELNRRYQWKNTIGPVEDRPLLIDRWNDGIGGRPTPDYFQTFGLGFYEYFQLCEDIGASPLPILNCGMACQFASGQLCPLDELGPYIQDALDLIEFANGPVTSPWGARRAAMGHPRPFHLKMLGVGNEQWGQQYLDRYTRFAAALKKEHPEIMLVACVGASPSDKMFQFLSSKMSEWHADIVDHHCYANPSWFFSNAHRYNDYDPNGPKVFMGEYAAQSVGVVSPKNRNTWECALSEAAYMTGLERNAAIVHMASYAPLFGNVDAWQWTPNLIWFDSHRVYGTPSYYVQQLFSHNRGDVVLPVSNDDPGATNLFFTAARDDKAKEIIIKVVNAGAQPAQAEIQLDGAPSGSLKAQATILAGNLADENSFDQPRRVAPVTTPGFIVGPSFHYAFQPDSLTVIRVGPTLPLVSPIFGDDMVLQRGKPARFWGWGAAGESIRIELAGATATAIVGADGRWQAEIETPAPGGPYTVKISGAEQTVVLHDVLVGNVWLCGGQSNMELGLARTRNGAEEIAAANCPEIRLYKVQSHVWYSAALAPQGSWKICSPQTIAEQGGFSAVAYFFGRRLQDDLHVPIGLIEDCMGVFRPKAG